MSTIKPAQYNAIDFTNSFTRVGNTFDANRQRVRNIIAPVTGVLSFEYIPGVMPDDPPDMTLTANLSTGTVDIDQTTVIELTDRYIYLFNISLIGLVPGKCDFNVKLAGIDEVVYSEKCEAFDLADFPENNLVRVVAYNADSTHGYITSTYPACGFFEVSDLNGRQFGNSKVEYNRSYGRKMILSSENYIKTRFTFLNLSLYQQNLLKWLCNCETLSINGTTYNLVSDFTPRNQDELNEICDITADFVEVSQTFFTEGATEVASEIQPTNLFM